MPLERRPWSESADDVSHASSPPTQRSGGGKVHRGSDLPHPSMIFGALVRLGRGDETPDVVLKCIVALAGEAVPDVSEASLTLTDGSGSPYTAAATSPTMVDLDLCQYEELGGPCTQALIEGETVVIQYMAKEVRWPRYRYAATLEGARSALAIPLGRGPTPIGTLNLISARPYGFSPANVELAETFATYAYDAYMRACRAHASPAFQYARQEGQPGVGSVR